MATTFKTGTRILTGDAELDAKLSLLKIGAANKIARPALTKAARLLLKKMKQMVPSQFKDAKRALGMAVDSKGGQFKNVQRSKVGVAVGKASKATRRKRGNRPGVGIGPENLHWFILGTAHRETGSVQRKNKSGKYRKSTGNAVHSTGTMGPRPELVGIVSGTTNAAKSEIETTIRDEVTTRLAALAKQGG